MRIEYHRTLIADDVRMDHLHAALKRVIVPGQSVVADIGTGTGVLAVMAAKLGAREIICYESEAVGAVAEATIRENGLDNVCVFPCSSLEIEDPPLVDIVISETLGNYAFEEHMIDTLVDARQRHLKPGGVLLPRSVSQFVAPVVVSRYLDDLRRWDSLERFGIAMCRARDMSLNNVYVRAFQPKDLLGGSLGGSLGTIPLARCWDRVDFSAGQDTATGEISGRRSADLSWPVAEIAAAEATRAAGANGVSAYGLCVWWEADFGLDLPLSTAPDAPPTHWEQLYFPSMPVVARPGDELIARLTAETGLETGTDFSWQMGVKMAGGEIEQVQAMSLDRGYLP